jgi:hypothetical protein
MEYYSGKISKETIQITLDWDGNKKDIDALVIGNFAVFNDGGYFNVTETSSGCRVVLFEYMKNAMFAMRLLHEELGDAKALNVKGEGYTEDQKNFVKNIKSMVLGSNVDLTLYGKMKNGN